MTAIVHTEAMTATQQAILADTLRGWVSIPDKVRAHDEEVNE